MTSNQVVLRVIAALDARQIPYMLVGSYSSNAYGSARSTQDADIVIELGSQSIGIVASDLRPDIELDPQLAFETVTGTYRYIARHRDSGFKVELFMLGNDPFDLERFRRRQTRSFLTGQAMLQTVEDVVVQKLRWFVRARRAKDLDDARNVIATQYPKLDLPYIRHWTALHSTADLFEQLLLECRQFEQETF